MTDRRLLCLTGTDAVDFLQGLVTNDVSKAEDGLVYAALLTPQGKYIADFFIAKEENSYLLDTDAAQTDALAKRLTMYKQRADVQITEDPRTVSTGTGEAPDGALADPRHPDLGWRLYADQNHSDQTDWTDLHVRHVIPAAGAELTPDSFLLEMGFERLGGIDFKKGCYVGQEINARMKHKTQLRKGLAQVSIEGTAPVGTDITNESGKIVGTLFRQSHGKALAYLRFDRAAGPLTAGTATLTYTPV